MQDVPETQPPRFQWKPWHLLLLVLPGVVFLGWLPLRFQRYLEPRLAAIVPGDSTPAQLEHEREYERRSAVMTTTMEGVGVSLLVLFAVLIFLTTKTRGRRGLSGVEAAVLFNIMLLVNGLIMYGGCSAGDWLKTRKPQLQPAGIEAPTAPAATVE